MMARMNLSKVPTLVALATFCLGTSVWAQVINGTLDGDESFYGTALSIQNTETQFGDAFLGEAQIADGSEIDQVFGTVSGDRLYLLVTGNLESNFNKLEVFIDSGAGGVNTIVGSELPATVDGFCCTQDGVNLPDPTNGALQRMDGLTFDAGFNADYFLTFTNGDESTPEAGFFWALSAHYADLTQGTNGAVQSLGIQLDARGNDPNGMLSTGEILDQNNNAWSSPDDVGTLPLAHEFVEDLATGDTTNFNNHRNMTNTIDLEMAIDNSNIDGVFGGTEQTIGNPEEVVTGVEFSIPLSAIGNPTGDIRVTTFINGTGHDYASNQFGGTGILTSNPGGDGTGGFTGDLAGVDLNNYDGDQFVTIANSSTAAGDFNADGIFDCDDIDPLVVEIVDGTNDPAFDLTGDGLVDNADLDEWLAVGAAANGLSSPYKEGDYNLDGVVDVTDFNIWNNGKFTAARGWCSGDGNADGFVDVTDFNLWNTNKFTSSDVVGVPEPSAWVLLGLGLIGFLRRRQ